MLPTRGKVRTKDLGKVRWQDDVNARTTHIAHVERKGEKGGEERYDCR